MKNAHQQVYGILTEFGTYLIKAKFFVIISKQCRHLGLFRLRHRDMLMNPNERCDLGFVQNRLDSNLIEYSSKPTMLLIVPLKHFF